jgi:hypothetical protein
VAGDVIDASRPSRIGLLADHVAGRCQREKGRMKTPPRYRRIPQRATPPRARHLYARIPVSGESRGEDRRAVEAAGNAFK